jgi:hypothetical protein
MNHRAIWLTAAVLAVVVLLAQVAGAATREMPASLPTSASVSTELTAITPTVALPDQASSVATENSATGVATANEAITSNGPATTTTAQVNKAPAAAAPVDASTGARPGWGCGDTNHTHSGPPGRPDATPPPGCTP